MRCKFHRKRQPGQHIVVYTEWFVTAQSEWNVLSLIDAFNRYANYLFRTRMLEMHLVLLRSSVYCLTGVLAHHDVTPHSLLGQFVNVCRINEAEFLIHGGK